MKNPNWHEKEVMLALDLYFSKDLAWLNKMSDSTFEIVGLSSILNALDIHPIKPDNFRSTGSIRMKLANFMALDERYEKKALGNVGGLDRQVWNKYVTNHLGLHEQCKEIVKNHLQSTNDTIKKYIEEEGLNDTVILVEKDFVIFSKSLKQTLTYYEELAKNNPNNKYSQMVINTCQKTKKSFDWTEKAGEVIFEYDYKEHAGVNLKPLKKQKKSKAVIDSGESNKEEKIGKYIQRTFFELVKQDKVSDELIEQLTLKKYSKDNFGIKPSFLKEVKPGIDLKEQITDENGYVRYWTKPVIIHGKEYCICKEWFENQRDRYNRWLSSVDIHPFYMLKPNELRKILEYLKENDSKKVNITRQEIITAFPKETTGEVLDTLIDMGVLSPFQGSARELVIDDYDALYRMIKTPRDYSGE